VERLGTIPGFTGLLAAAEGGDVYARGPYGELLRHRDGRPGFEDTGLAGAGEAVAALAPLPGGGLLVELSPVYGYQPSGGAWRVLRLDASGAPAGSTPIDTGGSSGPGGALLVEGGRVLAATASSVFELGAGGAWSPLGSPGLVGNLSDLALAPGGALYAASIYYGSNNGPWLARRDPGGAWAVLPPPPGSRDFGLERLSVGPDGRVWAQSAGGAPAYIGADGYVTGSFAGLPLGEGNGETLSGPEFAPDGAGYDFVQSAGLFRLAPGAERWEPVGVLKGYVGRLEDVDAAGRVYVAVRAASTSPSASDVYRVTP
jgi:hypothetical protein